MFSDSDYKKLTAEIEYKGEPIAQINQDKGKDLLELEIFTDFCGDEKFEVKVPLSDFIEALRIAGKSLCCWCTSDYSRWTIC